MASKNILRTVIADQLNELESLDDSVPRTIFKNAVSYSGTSAFVVKGIRRCGKSTLLKQLMKARFENSFFYFNFDDERVSGFKTGDFQTLMETMIDIFGERKVLFLDEVQNVVGWELFVNRTLRQRYTVFITGSNVSLLSKELGTHLTGRHVDVELYPFSFTEYLRAEKAEPLKTGVYTTEEKANLTDKFKEYLHNGGMPEVVVFQNKVVLTGVLNDIIQRDISERYKVRKIGELRAVLRFLISNASNPVTVRSISENFALSPNTVQKYLEYAEEAYLVFTVPRFERRLRRLDKNPRKIYCVDNGIITKNTPSFSERQGALLENLVAIHLKRLGWEFYYYKGRNGAEADFYVPESSHVIQVCYELSYENERRELKGIFEAMKDTQSSLGSILTFEDEREIVYKSKQIQVKPVWQWLLENEA